MTRDILDCVADFEVDEYRQKAGERLFRDLAGIDGFVKKTVASGGASRSKAPSEMTTFAPPSRRTAPRIGASVSSGGVPLTVPRSASPQEALDEMDEDAAEAEYERRRQKVLQQALHGGSSRSKRIPLSAGGVNSKFATGRDPPTSTSSSTTAMLFRPMPRSSATPTSSSSSMEGGGGGGRALGVGGQRKNNTVTASPLTGREVVCTTPSTSRTSMTSRNNNFYATTSTGTGTSAGQNGAANPRTPGRSGRTPRGTAVTPRGTLMAVANHVQRMKSARRHTTPTPSQAHQQGSTRRVTTMTRTSSGNAASASSASKQDTYCFNNGKKNLHVGKVDVDEGVDDYVHEDRGHVGELGLVRHRPATTEELVAQLQSAGPGSEATTPVYYSSGAAAQPSKRHVAATFGTMSPKTAKKILSCGDHIRDRQHEDYDSAIVSTRAHTKDDSVSIRAGAGGGELEHDDRDPPMAPREMQDDDLLLGSYHDHNYDQQEHVLRQDQVVVQSSRKVSYVHNQRDCDRALLLKQLTLHESSASSRAQRHDQTKKSSSSSFTSRPLSARGTRTITPRGSSHVKTPRGAASGGNGKMLHQTAGHHGRPPPRVACVDLHSGASTRPAAYNNQPQRPPSARTTGQQRMIGGASSSSSSSCLKKYHRTTPGPGHPGRPPQSLSSHQKYPSNTTTTLGPSNSTNSLPCRSSSRSTAPSGSPASTSSCKNSYHLRHQQERQMKTPRGGTMVDGSKNARATSGTNDYATKMMERQHHYNIKPGDDMKEVVSVDHMYEQYYQKKKELDEHGQEGSRSSTGTRSSSNARLYASACQAGRDLYERNTMWRRRRCIDTRQEKERRELAECTFTPRLVQSTTTPRGATSTAGHGNSSGRVATVNLWVPSNSSSTTKRRTTTRREPSTPDIYARQGLWRRKVDEKVERERIKADRKRAEEERKHFQQRKNCGVYTPEEAARRMKRFYDNNLEWARAREEKVEQLWQSEHMLYSASTSSGGYGTGAGVMRRAAAYLNEVPDDHELPFGAETTSSEPPGQEVERPPQLPPHHGNQEHRTQLGAKKMKTIPPVLPVAEEDGALGGGGLSPARDDELREILGHLTRLQANCRT
ncbi:unnamed protein product [Amoebophrya sp. A25]|nr:unnamed protein product [Amoebophrya sp. A25]|eukprot:GSA25T00001405001.1